MAEGRKSAPDLVTRPDELGRVIREVRAAGTAAVDTEFMRERTYRARLCLVQVATPSGLWLIDPLEPVDLRPVAELVADPGVEVIVHAGRQDFEIFYELYGTVPARVFDVQIAAGFAGYGASLPYGRLVEALTGTTLSKGESYTDWCARPLSDRQVAYAADDVAHLHPVAERLKRELERLGRLEWALEEMRLAYEDPDSYRFDPLGAYRRVTGRGTLNGRQLAVLREVARWREEAAARRNLPRGWVIKDPTLVEIARRMPSSPAELRAIRGMGAREVDRSGREILAAVERGRRAAPVEAPPAPPRQAQIRARVLAGLADALVRARAERAGIASELVATRAELESLIAAVVSGAEPDGHRLLTGWRKELAGQAVVALARGEIAIRATDEPPYVEELPVAKVAGS